MHQGLVVPGRQTIVYIELHACMYTLHVQVHLYMNASYIVVCMGSIFR